MIRCYRSITHLGLRQSFSRFILFSLKPIEKIKLWNCETQSYIDIQEISSLSIKFLFSNKVLITYNYEECIDYRLILEYDDDCCYCLFEN